MEKVWDVIVLGAGASGTMAAITAAAAGRRVLLFEHKDKIGKKIYATGNGRCNFTNEDMDICHFYGNRAMAGQVMSQFSQQDTISFFHQIGIYPKCKNGYYYPNSQTASSVVKALEMELARRKVTIKTGVCVSAIFSRQGRRGAEFILHTQEGDFTAGRLVIATGLLASPSLGSDGSAMELVKSLGHHFLPVVPALCAFSAKGMRFREAAGVRTDARIQLYVDGKLAAEDTGELQLTEYGISGIPVFQVSRCASTALYEKRSVKALLDFCPAIRQDELYGELSARFSTEKCTTVQQLNGLLNHKLFSSLLERAGISADRQVADLDGRQIRCLTETIKAYSVELTAPKGFEHAQVCAGGIRDEEINPQTLESTLQKGLYFSGEILNVDGVCGGYNLQWAWSSGAVAGWGAAGS